VYNDLPKVTKLKMEFPKLVSVSFRRSSLNNYVINEAKLELLCEDEQVNELVALDRGYAIFLNSHVNHKCSVVMEQVGAEVDQAHGSRAVVCDLARFRRTSGF